jgi:outer membrane lipoprotein carrier protein
LLEVCNRMDFAKFWLRRRQAISSALIFCLVGLAPATAVQSQPEADPVPEQGPVELVERFAEDVDDLKALFTQTVIDANGELVEEPSSGQFLLLRPNRFAWYYDTPYELEIIADGDSLWIYDVDLEQITVSPLSGLAESPAMLLSGEGTVDENFYVSEIEPEAGRRWIELTPNQDDSEFVSAKIAFRDGLPEALELLDGFSNLTSIEFTVDANSTSIRHRASMSSARTTEFPWCR